MSKKPTPRLPDDLEKELKDYFTSPEPGPEFVSRLERGLHSKLKEQEQKQMFGRSKVKLAWGFGLVIAAVLIGLLVTSPTVVTAMKRLLGYIPGVGIVESGGPLRVLAEPVSQTREGITITINEAVLSSEKTVIVFTVENIPFDKLSHREDMVGCHMSAELRLADGSSLQMIGGEGSGWGTGYENRFTYQPIPADVNEATLLIPCIQDVLPGELPENWELPLRFVPAPPDMTLMPVVEVTPSPDASGKNPLVLEKVIETDKGYILIGRFYSIGLPEGTQALHLNGWPQITDASGHVVPFNEPDEFVEHARQGGEVPWAYKIEGKQFDWPLILTFESLAVEHSDARTEFEFDTGPNPQTGQVRELNLDLEIAGYPLRIASATRTEEGYSFDIKTDPAVQSVRLEIAGMATSGGEGDGNGHLSVSVTYEGEIPSGNLTVLLSRPMVERSGHWQLQWQPDNTPVSGITSPLSITKTIDAGDSYILIGEFYQPATSDNGTWSPQPGGLILTDGNGQEIYWDYPQDIDLPADDWPNIQPWAVKVTKGFVLPLHIIYPVQYIFLDPSHARYEFEFDAGSNPEAGQTWDLNKEIHLAGYTFTLTSISVTPPLHGAQADGYNFSFISPDGKLSGVSVDIEGYTPLGGGGGGGGGGPEVSTTWGVGLTYTDLPKGRLKIVISNLSLFGETKEWTLEWQPDDSAGSNLPASTKTPQACLTMESWQAALTNPAQIPADLTGKVVAYGRIVDDGKDPSPDNYGIYVANLDGSEKQVIGQGVWASLSPDGSQVAYAWENGLYLADTATGESNLIPNTNSNDYNPRWSPDGTRIAFVRIDDFNLYTMNLDGSGLQKVIDAIDYEELIDWSPDGTSLFYGVATRDGMLLKKLDLASGAITDLFTVNNKALYADLSPDGSKIAFFDGFSEMTSGLYVSRLDGSNRKLVAQMGHWMVVNPRWSPDGKWLLVGIVNTDVSTPEEATALINLQTCQIIPLPITGTFYSWVP
jgi:hypothetical protein